MRSIETCDLQVTELGAALAWLLRNRTAEGRAYRRRTGRPHPEFGGGAAQDAARGLARHLLAEAPALASMIAAPGTAGAAPASRDPTHGALFIHAHWQRPAWAAPLRATALIGPFLFLRLPVTRASNRKGASLCSQASRPSRSAR